MNTREVAAVLETHDKVLRRFLRLDSNADLRKRFQNDRDRYVFKKKDMPLLTKRFRAWQGDNVPTKLDPPPDGPGLPVRVVRSTRTKDREKIAALSHARVDRLEAALKARGLHISQMKERATFRRVPA